MIHTRRVRVLGGVLFLSMVGCTRDDGLNSFGGTSVAVTAGDFDEVALPLKRMGVPYELYDGIISTATWDESLAHEQLAVSVEDLFGSTGELIGHKAVFVASGTRGFGFRQYNSLQEDAQIVSNEQAIENIRGYVERGGVLVVTDWAYDLVEAAWPDEVEFLGDDLLYDDAQRGEIGTVQATVVDADVVEDLRGDVVSLRYDYSNWAIIQEVSNRTDVYLEGTVTYRTDTNDSSTSQTLVDSPLMIGFSPRGGRGHVVYSTFHLDAQTAGMVDGLLQSTVGGLQEDFGGSTSIP